jgi:hypothetical protein
VLGIRQGMQIDARRVCNGPQTVCLAIGYFEVCKKGTGFLERKKKEKEKERG